MSTRWSPLWGWRALGLATLYFVTARLGLLFEPVAGVTTPVWPPAGIALSALLLLGNEYWPAIFVGATLTNISVGVPIWVALIIGAGNTAQPVIGRALLRWRGFQNSLDQFRHVVHYVGLGAFAAPVVSATLGLLALTMSGNRAEPGRVWVTWWLGEMMGVLLVGSLVLTWSGADVRRYRWQSAVEWVFLLAMQTAVCFVLFYLPVRHVRYLLFPGLIACAVRFGQRGAVTSVFLTAVIAIISTAFGRGPFVTGSESDNLILLQTFLAVLALTLFTLGAAVEETQRAVRLREEILAVVSHDLKNPLAAIQIRIQQMKRAADEGRVPEQWLRQVKSLESSADRMQRLLDDLIDFAAITGGRLRIQPEPHEAAPLMQDAVRMLEPIAEQKKITLVNGGAGGVDEVICDRDRIFEVFFNLVGNAVTATPTGGTITLAATRRDTEVLFSVADSGPGIPPENLPYLFDRYWRAGREDRRSLGLGLAISRGIVEAHGGRIWAVSPPGAGATFLFTLPIARSRRAGQTETSGASLT